MEDSPFIPYIKTDNLEATCMQQVMQQYQCITQLETVLQQEFLHTNHFSDLKTHTVTSMVNNIDLYSPKRIKSSNTDFTGGG